MTRKKTKTRAFGAGNRESHDANRFYGSRLYEGLPRETPPEPDQALPANVENKIITGDARNMSKIPDRSVHLVVTSPPYNVAKEYDEDLSLQEYLDMLDSVFSEVHRVLVHGGRACVNVANVGRKPYIPLSDHISRLMVNRGFLMRGEIIWNKGAGAGTSLAWGSFKSASNPVLRDIHEYILIFSKGGYGRNKEGRESTISKENFMEWTKTVWTMQPERARRVNHPAPFPVELPRRLIELYTFRGDVVLDPFTGSGSTALAALETGRRFVGYELSSTYAQTARRRIRQHKGLDGKQKTGKQKTGKQKTGKQKTGKQKTG